MVFFPCSRVFNVNFVFSFLPFNIVSKHGNQTLATTGEKQPVQYNLSFPPILL